MKLVVSTSAIDCLERLVSEMTYYVSSGTLNHTHSLTPGEVALPKKEKSRMKAFYCAMHSLEWIIALLLWCLSISLSGLGVHCDHMMHFSADLCSWLDSPMFWALWHHSMPTYSQQSFSSSTWKKGGAWMYRAESRSGTVLCFRYAFLKQFCELKGQGSGRG